MKNAFRKLSVVLLVLFAMNIENVSAQSLWIDGVIYTIEGEACLAVPFATVTYCDPDDHEKIYYMRMTNLSGKYDLGKNVPARDYFIRIEAPGYLAREKTITGLPDHFDSEFTLHFRLEKDAYADKPTRESLSKKRLRKVVKQVRELPAYFGFTQKKDGLYTQHGGKVQVLFNGVTLNDLSVVNKIMELPVKYLSEVELYTIPKESSFPFEKVLNIVIAGQDRAQYMNKFRGTPHETSYYDKK